MVCPSDQLPFISAPLVRPLQLIGVDDVELTPHDPATSMVGYLFTSVPPTYLYSVLFVSPGNCFRLQFMVVPATKFNLSVSRKNGAAPGFGRSVFIKKSVSSVEVAGTDSGSDEGGVIGSPCNKEANGFSIIFLSMAIYPAATPPTSTMRHTNSNIMDDESPRRAISY